MSKELQEKMYKAIHRCLKQGTTAYSMSEAAKECAQVAEAHYNGWVSVETDLPPVYTDYGDRTESVPILFRDSSGLVYAGTLEIIKETGEKLWIETSNTGNPINHVVEWMPLPHPPKQDNNG